MRYNYLANGDLKLIENTIREDFTNNVTSFDYLDAFINYYNTKHATEDEDGNTFKIHNILGLNHFINDTNTNEKIMDILYEWECINKNSSGIDSQRVTFNNELQVTDLGGILSGTSFIKNETIQMPFENDILYYNLPIPYNPMRINGVQPKTDSLIANIPLLTPNPLSETTQPLPTTPLPTTPLPFEIPLTTTPPLRPTTTPPPRPTTTPPRPTTTPPPRPTTTPPPRPTTTPPRPTTTPPPRPTTTPPLPTTTPPRPTTTPPLPTTTPPRPTTTPPPRPTTTPPRPTTTPPPRPTTTPPRPTTTPPPRPTTTPPLPTTTPPLPTTTPPLPTTTPPLPTTTPPLPTTTPPLPTTTPPLPTTTPPSTSTTQISKINYTEKFLVGDPLEALDPLNTLKTKTILLGIIPFNSLLSNISYNISTVDLAFSSDSNQGAYWELAIQRYSDNKTITLWTSNKLWCAHDDRADKRIRNRIFEGLSSSKLNTISLQSNDMINIILTSIYPKHYPVITDIKVDITLIK